MLRKLEGKPVTVRQIEKEFRLDKQALVVYRANHYRKKPVRDGLYQVTTDKLCASFVIRDGEVIECAPILRKRITYWIRRARWIGPDRLDSQTATKTHG